MKKVLTALLAVLAVVTLAACSQQSSSKNSSSETTKLSSKPKIEGFSYSGKIPQNPKKVVNFAYSYTGYLLQLGVNVSSYSLDLEKDSPAFGKQLKNAKKLTSSDTEAIAAEEPDLIIAFSTDENLAKLKEIAPVLEIKYGASDYLTMMTNIGKVFGKEKAADKWLTSWKKKVATAKSELSFLPSSTTFTVMDLYDKNIYLYGKNWGRGGELIYDALGFSAPAKVQSDVFPTGYLSISQETVADYVGDYAVLNVNSDTKKTAAALIESDVWKNMTAVQQGHVLEVDYNLFYFSDPMSLDKQLDAFVAAVKKANQ